MATIDLVSSSSDEEVEWVPPPPSKQRVNAKLKRKSLSTTGGGGGGDTTTNTKKKKKKKKTKTTTTSTSTTTAPLHFQHLSPVPTPPSSYGSVPSHALVRRFYLPRAGTATLTIDQVKRAAIKHFPNGELYDVDDITLLAGRPPKEIRRPGQLHSALSYPDCFHILSGPPNVGLGVVAASVYNDWPSSLFIAPLAWPVTTECLRNHSQCHSRKRTNNGRARQQRISTKDAAFLKKMCDLDAAAGGLAVENSSSSSSSTLFIFGTI